MKIADVRLRQVAGTMAFEGEFWEDRVLRPIDVYPEFAAQGPGTIPRVGSGGYRIETIFVEIESDHGVVGIGGPTPRCSLRNWRLSAAWAMRPTTKNI